MLELTSSCLELGALFRENCGQSPETKVRKFIKSEMTFPLFYVYRFTADGAR